MQKDLRDIFLLFLYSYSLLRLKITPLWRGRPIFTYLDEGYISFCEWRFDRPIVYDEAQIQA